MPRLVALVTLGLAVFASNAEASSCFLGPIAAAEPRLGCPVAVYHHEAFAREPRLEVVRDNLRVDVTGTVTRSTTTLPVAYPQFTCNGEIDSIDTRDEPFAVFHVTLDNAREGEAVYVDGFPIGTVGAAATSCTDPGPPSFSCGNSYRPCDESDDEAGVGGGCHTSGNSCGGAALLVLGLAATRIRTRRRAARR